MTAGAAPSTVIHDPATTVLLLDVDGVLAPIVEDPATATVPGELLEALATARDTCVLVGCITGRSLAQALRMVPVERLWLGASHGMHVRSVDGSEDVDAVATAARPQLEMARTLAQTVGWRYEDKGCSVTMHFRHVANPELTARQMRAQIATVLDPRQVEVVDARMALEVRPVGARTKADAVRLALNAAGGAARHVIYVGDDTTDLDAFRALDEAALEATRVAVASEEGPPELLQRADVVLPSQAEVQTLLAQASA